MQIDFIKKAKNKTPIILTPAKYIVGANYAIKKHRLELLSLMIDFIFFFIWIGFGLRYLDGLTLSLSGWIKSVIFVDSFILINWLLALPIELYKIFKLDKEFQFSTITIKTYITDTIKSGILFLIFGSLVIVLLDLVIRNFEFWWLLGFLLIFIVIVIINIVYPIIRDKMFDKFTPLNEIDQNLYDKIIEESVSGHRKATFSIPKKRMITVKKQREKQLPPVKKQ
jgi:STE24 endopeptidase